MCMPNIGGVVMIEHSFEIDRKKISQWHAGDGCMFIYCIPLHKPTLVHNLNAASCTAFFCCTCYFDNPAVINDTVCGHQSSVVDLL